MTKEKITRLHDEMAVTNGGFITLTKPELKDLIQSAEQLETVKAERDRILDDVLVLLASNCQPTPEETYKKEGGWPLALSDIKRYIEKLKEARVEAISTQGENLDVLQLERQSNGKLKSETASLQKQVEELRRDKQRLDWLEKRDNWFGISGEFNTEAEVCGGKSYNQTVRQAIDAAIAKEGNKCT